MASLNSGDSQLNFVIPAEIKAVIEDAAATIGQSVNDFGIMALVEKSKQVLDGWGATTVSARDWDRLNSILDDESRAPNSRLLEAAKRYDEWQAKRAPE